MRDQRQSFYLEERGREERGDIAVLLDNIRSAWNVGAILRTADGFGFNHLYACGITPSPDNEAVPKTALGAQESVPWSYYKDALKLVKGLKEDGWKVLALEEDERSVDVRRIDHRAHSTVLILGNELTGVDPDLLDLCDTLYAIPMRGQKRSFNVAVAFGIAAYALKRE
jgi:tRNA G18 (ribose-2'-O)-methylase SpoU